MTNSASTPSGWPDNMIRFRAESTFFTGVQTRDGNVIPVFGDGSTSRGYTYSDDVLQVVLQARAFIRSAAEPVFELSVGARVRTVTLSEMIQVLGGEMGEIVSVEH
jgi:nucleoside-diphosphate-sugar epimerase